MFFSSRGSLKLCVCVRVVEYASIYFYLFYLNVLIKVAMDVTKHFVLSTLLPLTILSKCCSNFLISGFFIFHSEVKIVNISKKKNVVSKSIIFKKIFWGMTRFSLQSMLIPFCLMFCQLWLLNVASTLLRDSPEGWFPWVFWPGHWIIISHLQNVQQIYDST